MGYLDFRAGHAMLGGALVALACWGCASSETSSPLRGAPESAHGAASSSGPSAAPAAPAQSASAPDASQYAAWCAGDLLSDRALEDWRKKHSARHPDTSAIGILVLPTRNQTMDMRIDRWMEQFVSELAARLRPSGLVITGIDDADAEPGSLPKASLGLRCVVQALPSDGTRAGGAAKDTGVSAFERPIGPLEIRAELIDSASRRLVTGVRVRPPSS